MQDFRAISFWRLRFSIFTSFLTLLRIFNTITVKYHFLYILKMCKRIHFHMWHPKISFALNDFTEPKLNDEVGGTAYICATFPHLVTGAGKCLDGCYGTCRHCIGNHYSIYLNICIMYILAQRRSKIIFCYYLAKINLYLCDSQTLTPDDRNDILVEDCEDNH